MGRYISLQGHDALPVIVTIDGHDRIGHPTVSVGRSR